MKASRIQPLPPAEWPPEMATALAALRPPEARHPLPRRDESRPKGLNALGLLARHPALTTAFNTFNGHVLFGTTLTPRQRELLVLRVASRRDAPYEWAQHVVLARDAGITLDEIIAVSKGAVAADTGAARWAPVEAALLKAADELLDAACIGDQTWAVLAAELDERQLMDVVFTVGAYDLVAMAFRTFDVQLDEDLESRPEVQEAARKRPSR